MKNLENIDSIQEKNENIEKEEIVVYKGNSNKIKLQLGNKEIILQKIGNEYIINDTTIDRNKARKILSIGEGQELILGRMTEGLFQDDTVSKKHCKISLNQGELTIVDLNSRNGTSVEFEDSEDVNKETEEIDIIGYNEKEDPTRDTLKDFIKYMEENKEDILDKINYNLPSYEKKYSELNLEAVKFKLLTDIIYNDFYSQGESNFTENNPKDQEKFEQYEKNLKFIINLMTQQDEYQKKFKIVDSSGWYYALVNSDERLGSDNAGDLGRIYLNVAPEVSVGVFNQLIQKGVNQEISFQTKISKSGDSNSFNRVDKIVLYFKPEDSANIKSLVQEIYNKRESVFINQTPRFSQSINNYNGKIMNGVSFGQEPINRTKNEISFGEIRSRMLATIAKDVLAGNNDKDNIKEKFRKICSKFGVDSENPAFNSNNNSFNNFKTN